MTTDANIDSTEAPSLTTKSDFYECAQPRAKRNDRLRPQSKEISGIISGDDNNGANNISCCESSHSDDVMKACVLLCSLQTLPLATELWFTGHHMMLTGESG